MDMKKPLEDLLLALKGKQNNRLYIKNLDELKNEFESKYLLTKSIFPVLEDYDSFFEGFTRYVRSKYTFVHDDYINDAEVFHFDPLDGTWLKGTSYMQNFSKDKEFVNALPITRWGRFLYFLYKEKKFSLETVLNVGNSSIDVIARCHNPNSPSEQFVKGMVVGSVQSGKTTNFNAVINAAYDIGFNMVIVLTGITEDLRKQTQRRLNEDLGICEPGKGVNRIIENSAINIRDINSLTGNKDFDAAALDAKTHVGNQLSLMVSKKNKDSLLNIYKFLNEKIAENAIDVKNFNLLIVDDEADNATLNGVGYLNNDSDATAINGLMRGILGLFKKKTYVAYTATPFANILQDINLEGNWNYSNRGIDYEIALSGNLFPDNFVRLLDPPANYIGPRYFFDLDPSIQDNFHFLIKEISDTELHFPERFDRNSDEPVLLVNDEQDFESIEELKEIYGDFGTYKTNTRAPRTSDSNCINAIPYSLKDAVLCFVLTIAVRRIRAELYPELNDMQKHNSMLIHISRFSNWQNKLKTLLTNSNHNGYLDIVFNQLGIDNKGEGIYADFERVWNYHYADIIGNLNGVMENHYHDPYIQKHELSHIFNVLPAVARDGIDVVSINTNSPEDFLNYNGKQGKNYIAIGGNRLSRGFTLEGLSISYFTRTTGYADAILQMGRWFGYRPGYLDCCRLFTDRNSNDKFRECISILDDLEKDIKQHMADPSSSAKKIVNRIRSTSGDFIKITRPNILRNAELAYFSFSDKLIQTAKFDLYRSNHIESWERFGKFFSKYHSLMTKTSETSSSYKLTVSDFDVVKELIETSTLLNKSFDKERLFDFIEKQREEFEYLKTWDIIFINNSTGRGDGEIVEIGDVKLKTVVRSGPSKDTSDKANARGNKLYARLQKDGYYNVRNSSVITPSDMSLGLSDVQIREIKAETNRKSSIPEYVYRRKYGKYRGIVLVYLIDTKGVLKGDLNSQLKLDLKIPIVAFGIGIPDLEVEPQVYYLNQREKLEADLVEENVMEGVNE